MQKLKDSGGTPLAAGLDAAFVLSDSVRRKGQTPTVIVLTDGRAFYRLEAQCDSPCAS